MSAFGLNELIDSTIDRPAYPRNTIAVYVHYSKVDKRYVVIHFLSFDFNRSAITQPSSGKLESSIADKWVSMTELQEQLHQRQLMENL